MIAALLLLIAGVAALLLYAGHLIGYADGYATGWLEAAHQADAIVGAIELCPTCHGERRVIIHNQPTRCPQCDGTGLHTPEPAAE